MLFVTTLFMYQFRELSFNIGGGGGVEKNPRFAHTKTIQPPPLKLIKNISSLLLS